MPGFPSGRHVLASVSARAARFLQQVDPGAHRRIKGLRLVTAYGIAALLATLRPEAGHLPGRNTLPFLAGGLALWASVSEAQETRFRSSRDLFLLVAAGASGAGLYAVGAGSLRALGHAGPELVLAGGAFLVGYLRRFGVTGAGVGSQVFIGQLLSCSSRLDAGDLPAIAAAGLLACAGAVVPRLLSGPAEHPETPAPVPAVLPKASRPELVMGLQAAAAALAIVALDAWVGLSAAPWAITACTYIISGTAQGTLDRAIRRVGGTIVGVPLGLACLPLATAAPALLWAAAGLAMIVYAMALPVRYDIACAAYAFTLVTTLAASGDTSVAFLAERLWETVLGSAVGLAAATLLLPLRTPGRVPAGSGLAPTPRPAGNPAQGEPQGPGSLRLPRLQGPKPQ